MSRRGAALLTGVAWRALIVAGLIAPPPAAAQGGDNPGDAVTILMQRASFWSDRHRPDEARSSLARLLQLNPAHADAWAALTEIEAAEGHREAAATALARLRGVAPQDPRLARLAGAIRIGRIDDAALEQARRLAREGQSAEAVVAYDRIFVGNLPPAPFAIEYFQALRGTPDGWEAARDGLAALVRETPLDLAAQLAYAQALTDRDGARAEGLERLTALARIPSVAGQATASLRAVPPAQTARAVALTPIVRPALDAAAAAIRQSDVLTQQGKPNAALGVMAGALAARPADPTLGLAMSRLYRAAGRPRDAQAVAEAALLRDPADAQARQAAVEAALAVGDAARADRLAQDGIRLTPSDPAAWFASAELARSRDDRQATLLALRRARALRAGQLAGAALPPAIVLATQAPADVRPAPAADDQAALHGETDEDGDMVMVRGRMLDTDATDLPPPLRDTAAASAVPRDKSPVDAAPPRELFIGASQQSAEEPGAEGAPAPSLLADLAAPDSGPDPMTARIDRDIAAASAPSSSDAQAAIAFRGRSGTSGASQLAEITVPLEASFAAGESGRIRLAVTPTFLSAGSLSEDAASRGQFGSLALGPRAPGASIARQTADGAGLDVAFATHDVSADIGSTPLGFRQQNVVGGVEWAPLLDQGVRLRLTGERRAVTDSLLSYAGARDPRTGQDWGGVTYARGHANLEFSAGTTDLYIGGGGGVLDGHNVKSNTEIEASAGASTPLFKDATQELRLGLDLVYFSYAKNLSGFSLGQGGYFSPQSYVAALIPLTFKDRPTERLSYEIGGTAGVQTYREDSSPTFPDDAVLQSALVAQQANSATALAGVNTALPSKRATGFSGGAHAAIDYLVAADLHLGAKVDYEHTGDFNQTVGLLYARLVFGGATQR